MGSPIAPLLAAIIMNRILTEMSNQQLKQPKALFRYVDDIFCIFHDHEELNAYL